MKKLTIDETIAHIQTVIKEYERCIQGKKFTNKSIYCCKQNIEEHKQLVKWLEELKVYKQLKEQELLLELPCKIGDTVYRVYLDGEYTVSWWAIERDIFTLSYYEKYKDDFGKKIFVTPEKAKEKLEELENKRIKN